LKDQLSVLDIDLLEEAVPDTSILRPSKGREVRWINIVDGYQCGAVFGKSESVEIAFRP
jgi:hypothetical protein